MQYASETFFLYGPPATGKSTCAKNLAAALGQLGCRVLLADLDPQGNATSGVGINKREVKISSYHVLMEESGAAEANKPFRKTVVADLSSSVFKNAPACGREPYSF